MSESVNVIASGKIPIATAATGAGISAILKYLELFNSVGALISVCMMCLGGYWMYRKNKAEAQRIEIGNETDRLVNLQTEIDLKSRKIQIDFQESFIKLIQSISK